MFSGRSDAVRAFSWNRGERARRAVLAQGRTPGCCDEGHPAQAASFCGYLRIRPAKASGVYKDVRITYKTNAHGWRSREIDPASPNKKIMFVGCSYTMGIGLPYEDVWTSVATRHIEEALGEPVEQHNFGYGAHGNDFFAMVVHQVLPILKPDLLVVLFSDLSRRTVLPQVRPPDGVAARATCRMTPTAVHGAYLRASERPQRFHGFRAAAQSHRCRCDS